MLQNLMVMREEILYSVFLDLHKAYGALDRDKISVNYGGLESGTADSPPLMYILGLACNDGPSGWVLRHGVKGVLGCEPRRSDVLDHF